MSDLPILNCDGCGVCCMEMGTPPFLGCEIYELPDDLREYVLEHSTEDRETSGLPCYWFDLDTKKCTQYENRPMVCRDFEVGCPACKSYREHYRIDECES